MFESARIKLTLVYVAMFLAVTGTVSLLFYQGTTMVLEGRFYQIEHRMMTQSGGSLGQWEANRQLSLLKEDLEETKRQIVARLAVINGVIVVVYAVAGYILSGKTLQPIETAVKEQEEFVANAAHELRTPLAAMKATTEVELRTGMRGRSRRVLKENLEEIEKLEGLTEKLLMLARLDEVNQLEVTKVEMGEIITEAAKLVKPIASRKGVKLVTRGVKQQAKVQGDGELLRVMVTALVDNAVKYTDSGGKVRVEQRVSKKKVILQVKDNGMGMNKETCDNLFRRFYRGDKSRVKAGENGYGLGLALVEKIVCLHGGKIGVQSKLAEGSNFRVELARAGG